MFKEGTYLILGEQLLVMIVALEDRKCKFVWDDDKKSMQNFTKLAKSYMRGRDQYKYKYEITPLTLFFCYTTRLGNRSSWFEQIN